MILESKYNWAVELNIQKKKKKKKKSRFTQDELEKQETFIRDLWLIGNHTWDEDRLCDSPRAKHNIGLAQKRSREPGGLHGIYWMVIREATSYFGKTITVLEEIYHLDLYVRDIG